jgi:serine protease SohB
MLQAFRACLALVYQGVNVEFLAEYASFLAKTATLVIAILMVLSAIAGLRGKGGASRVGNCRSPASTNSTKSCVSAWSRVCSTRRAQGPAQAAGQGGKQQKKKARAETPGVRPRL